MYYAPRYGEQAYGYGMVPYGMGMVGGGYGGEYEGSGLVGGKLPKELREALGSVNADYKKAQSRGAEMHQKLLSEGKVFTRGSQEAKARAQKAAATRRDTKAKAIQLTAQIIGANPAITSHQADSIFKDYKKAVSAEKKYAKQYAYRAAKAEKAGKRPPVQKGPQKSVASVTQGIKVVAPKPRKAKA